MRTICDVDTKEDVAELRNRLREKKSWQCCETGRFLMRNQTISVIVPVYNEASTIEKIQRELLPLKDRCEILFVDGGSTHFLGSHAHKTPSAPTRSHARKSVVQRLLSQVLSYPRGNTLHPSWDQTLYREYPTDGTHIVSPCL